MLGIDERLVGCDIVQFIFITQPQTSVSHFAFHFFCSHPRPAACARIIACAWPATESLLKIERFRTVFALSRTRSTLYRYLSKYGENGNYAGMSGLALRVAL